MPLRSVSPAAPLADLAPFLELAAGHSLIGLGEPTHGTREAFQLKHRLIRALAEGAGLRTVAFECGLAAGRLIDDYVRSGRGNARRALAQQGFWCWDNQEVLGLLEWLRKHNAALPAPERIAFVGIDVQRIEPGLPELLAALEAEAGHGPGAAHVPASQEFVEVLSIVRQLLAGELVHGAPEAGEAVRLLLEAAPRLRTPGLRALCRNAARYVDVYLNPAHDDGLVLRDEYLAATALETLAERPGLTVVWAHNEHVAVNPDFFGARAMGHHLRETLGEQYLALGMLFGEGRFLSRCWHERMVREFQVGPAGKDHVERCFTGRRPGLYRTASLPAASQARYRRFVGGLYADDVAAENPAAFRIGRPLADFDFVAWLPQTAAARHLGAGSAPPAWEPA